MTLFQGKFEKLNNEYVLAIITALIVIFASAISLSILAAAINFSSAPIKNNDVQAKIIQVEPFKEKKKKTKSDSGNGNKSPNSNVKVIKVNP